MIVNRQRLDIHIFRYQDCVWKHILYLLCYQTSLFIRINRHFILNQHWFFSFGLIIIILQLQLHQLIEGICRIQRNVLFDPLVTCCTPICRVLRIINSWCSSDIERVITEALNEAITCTYNTFTSRALTWNLLTDIRTSYRISLKRNRISDCCIFTWSCS